MNDEFYEPVFDLSKLQDRGNKKWVAMMLPEHVALLREYSKEIKREPRPDLNEWDYDAINHTLDEAIKSKADTKVKLWRDGTFIYKRGIVESVDLRRRVIELEDPFSLLQLKLDEIVDVTIMD
ncbi:YolD-like protein [Psychrobacillus sp. OK028]|uniref:YolD-like family protein n=1 Tax=Psychrobacillus sp. OK028 TaxID=1884359 RepID=UPI0008825C96|nr:YolD-like family protein [Psychrobacillus sp. OK028]SDN16100.1 YolD-like protein [Psychrobacillus sp. OK028]